MSRVFWCLFCDAILKEVPTPGFEEGRGEIRDRDRAGGSTGRVRSLVVLSHRIGATEQKSRPKIRFHHDPHAPDLIPPLAGDVASLYCRTFIAEACFLQPVRPDATWTFPQPSLRTLELRV